MKTHVNLLPWAYRRRQLIFLRLRHWSSASVVAVLVIAAAGWTQWSQYRAGVVRVESLQREYAPIEAMKEETENLRQRIEELRQREALAFSLADEQSMLNLMGLLSRAARHCDGKVSIQQLSLERQANRSADEGFIKTLALSGVAASDELAASFSESLRSSGAFLHVELKSTAPKNISGPNRTVEARTYQLECKF